MTRPPVPVADLLALSDADKALRFDAMVRATYSHVDGRDLLAELHPRSELDVRRCKDRVVTWHEGDWLTTLLDARDDAGFVAAPTEGAGA